MPGIRLLTNAEWEDAVRLIRRAAEDFRFSVAQLEEDELRLQKGNVVASIFLGAIAPYHDFRIRLEVDKKGRLEIDLERNVPWWTGWIGLSAVKRAAVRLADWIEEDIEDRGGRVYDRHEY